MPEIIAPNSAGSAANMAAGSQAKGPASSAGEPNKGQENYRELETKLGEQGRELGEYRNFVDGIAPLLEKLDKSPEIVQAILDGKINVDIANAIIEGRVDIKSAEVVTQAHKEVKKDLGKDYKNTDPENIAKLVEERAQELRKEFEGKFKESDEIREFQDQVNQFIANTPDFVDYAEAVDKWLDEHDVTDISVAYYAVKGQLSEREAKKQAAEDAAEAAKNLALNAGGGQGRSTHVVNDANVIDSLIAGRSNPNVF